MKRNFKFYALALSLLMGGALMSACSTDENDPTPDNGTLVIKPVKAPDHILYSGGKVIGTTLGSRAANVEGNLWYKNWDRPTNVTEEEIAKVLEAVKEPRVGAKNDIHIDWNNYWVQQVYTGEATYTDGYGNNIGTGSSHMNKLLAYSSKKNDVVSWWDEATQGPVYELKDKGPGEDPYEHVNNFNNGSNNTVYTDDETKEQFVGTTLMTDMYAEGIIDQFGYHNTTDSKNHYEYIIIEVDGSYYICFDFYATHPEGQEANKNMDVERDWIFNDWIVKISPAYHVGETPEEPVTPPTDPEQPGDDDPTEPETPKNVVPDNHVEINLSINDEKNQGFDGIVSKLSVHLRAATDVEIFIPVPAEFIIPQDDMNIFKAHNDELVYGGNPDVTIEGSEFVTEYSLNGHNITLTIKHGKDGITITTDGMTQDILDECQAQYGDGLNFEIYNYFEFKEESEFAWENYWSVLKEYFDKATVRFTNEPDAYVNAFNKTEDGEKFERDCTVSIVDEQIGDYPNHWTGKHYNGSPYNEIYSKQE